MVTYKCIIKHIHTVITYMWCNVILRNKHLQRIIMSDVFIIILLFNLIGPNGEDCNPNVNTNIYNILYKRQWSRYDLTHDDVFVGVFLISFYQLIFETQRNTIKLKSIILYSLAKIVVFRNCSGEVFLDYK